MTVEDFFATYADAFAAGDLDGVARCYGYPSIVLTNGTVLGVQDEADVRAAFSGVADLYRSRGVVQARPRFERIAWVTEQIADVDVQWEYFDGAGAVRGGDRYRYTVRDTGSGPRIHLVVPRPAREPSRPAGQQLG